MKVAAALVLFFAPAALALAPPPCPAPDHTHAGFGRVLSQYVRDGGVDYARMKAGGAPELAAYLAALEGVCKADLEAAAAPQQLAFWINAYNAYVLRLLLVEAPENSIREIGWLPGAAFRKEFIGLGRLVGRADDELSLGDIEHQIIRKRFSEPRVHFALNCGSASCPPLAGEPYRADRLEAQLDKATRDFMADRRHNRFDAHKKALQLSMVFDWYEDDFKAAAGSVKAFALRYLPADVSKAAAADDVRVEFLEYDWSLNRW